MPPLQFSSNAVVSSVGIGEATQAEAEAGAILGRYMSPLRVSQALQEGTLFSQAGAGAIDRTFLAKAREIKTLADYVTSAQAATDAANAILIVKEGESVTINVPATYATIALAWSAIRDWIINGTVTIQVADGTITHGTSGMTLNHPFGANIRVVGNETTPASCILEWSVSTVAGIYISNGNTLGYLNGFTIRLPTTVGRAAGGAGILLDYGSTLVCGDDVIVRNFYYSYAARYGSTIFAAGCESYDAGDAGFWAFENSAIYADGAYAEGTNDSGNGLGSGFVSEFGSALDCTDAEAAECFLAGVHALSGGSIRAHRFNSHDNDGSGAMASIGGDIEDFNATYTDNGRYGREVGTISDGAIFAGTGITSTGNTLGDNNFSIATVGILGSSLTPKSQVHALDTTASLGIYRWSNGTGAARLVIAKSRGATVGSYTISQASDQIGEIVFAASDGVDFAPACAIHALVDGTPGSNDMPGALAFATTADGANVVTDRLYLDKAGVLKPASNDGVPLGTGSLAFSDLFLASGAVVNFNNSDVTITHSTAALTVSGSLGIGGPSPIDSTLHVRGTNSNAGGIRIESSAGSAADRLAIFGSGNTSTAFQNLSSGNINWLNSSGNAVSILEGAGQVTFASGTAIPSGGTAGMGVKVSSTANFGLFFGSGAPTLSAAQGSLYIRSDGTTTNDRIYVNTNGTTGWTAVIAAT